MRQSILVATLLAAIPRAVVADPSAQPYASTFQCLGFLVHVRPFLLFQYQESTKTHRLVDGANLPLDKNELVQLTQQLNELVSDTQFWSDVESKSDGYATTWFQVGTLTFKRVRCEAEHDQFHWTITAS